MTDRGPRKGGLGEFEILVLLAVLQAGDAAYGSTILKELNERAGAGRRARGAVYHPRST